MQLAKVEIFPTRFSINWQHIFRKLSKQQKNCPAQETRKEKKTPKKYLKTLSKFDEIFSLKKKKISKFGKDILKEEAQLEFSMGMS